MATAFEHFLTSAILLVYCTLENPIPIGLNGCHMDIVNVKHNRSIRMMYHSRIFPLLDISLPFLLSLFSILCLLYPICVDTFNAISSSSRFIFVFECILSRPSFFYWFSPPVVQYCGNMTSNSILELLFSELRQ